MKIRSVSLMCIALLSGISASAQTRHYLDCTAGDDAHDSLSAQSAWKTIAKASSFVFQPGDSLLLRRGSVCSGLLWPKGSGTEGRTITLGAYGQGDLPQVIGTGQEAAVKLFNQQFWDVEDLNLTGGNPYGLYIAGTAPQLSHFHVRDVVVHDVTGQPKVKQSGLVVIGPADSHTLFNDVVVDGVTAYGTTQWAGVILNGAGFGGQEGHGSNLTVRNTVVHDVGGDGILLTRARHGLLERNVAWNTGMQYTQTIGTPDGIWEWMCDDCLVQYNEGFATDSPGVDGGVFDIDFGNRNNTVQYNFGHDSQGYCVSIFGAEGEPGYSHNSTISRNLCINNGRSPRLAQRQGAIYLSTWEAGKLDGVQISHNTIYWNPPTDTAAIVNEAVIEPGAPSIFRDNLVFSTVPTLLRSATNLDLTGNLYWTPLGSVPSWTYGASVFHTLSTLASATGQERHGLYTDPLLNARFQPTRAIADATPDQGCPVDLYGVTLPSKDCGMGALDPAVSPHSPVRLTAGTISLGGHPYIPHGWTLLALLTPEGHPGADLSRSQVVVLQSMIQQFSALGLHVDAVPSIAITDADAANWTADWNMQAVRLLASQPAKLASGWWPTSTPTGLALISPEGKLLRLWSGLATFAEVELTLRSEIGTPPGMQPIRFDLTDGDSRQ